MAKRVSGAGVNRSAARKAAAVAVLRRARQQEHERSVTESVAVFFDRSGRAGVVLAEARERVDRMLADAERTAAVLGAQADAAVARLKALGERPAEIARMLDLPVSGVRAALARAGGNAPTPQAVVPAPSPEPAGISQAPEVLVAASAAAGP